MWNIFTQRNLKRGGGGGGKGNKGGGGGGGKGRPIVIGGPRPFVAAPYIYYTGRRRKDTPVCLIEQDKIIDALGTPAEYWALENFTWGNTSECVEVQETNHDIRCSYTNTTLMKNVTQSCQAAGGKTDLVALSLSCSNSSNLTAHLLNLPFCQAKSCDAYLHTDYINGNSTAFWGDNTTGLDCNYTLYSGGTRVTAAYGAGMAAFLAYLVSLFI